MQATPDDMDLGPRRVGLAQIVVVILVLLATLLAGVVIGRGTAPAGSVVSVDRVPPSVVLIGGRSQDAQVRRQVMKEMNALTRSPAVVSRSGAADEGRS